MTVEESIREACRIRALVYHSIQDYSQPNDGFCDLCSNSYDPESFRDSGKVAEYIRLAVLQRLKFDGYAIHSNFDPETGVDISASSEKDEELARKRRLVRDAIRSL